MPLPDPADLDPTLSTHELAELTGLSPDVWWSVARGEAESPIPDLVPLRVGRAIRWPTAPVLRALQLDGQAPAISAATKPAAPRELTV
jgi:hypothetical protein